MASKFKERLGAMKGAWESSQGAYDQMFGGMKIPEGLYEARLQSAKLTESKKSGKLMIRREHLITAGKFKGMIAWDHMMLETPNGLVWVRRWIEMMGYQCPGTDDFEEQLEATIDAIVDEAPDVKIQIIHDGEFVNVSVNELLPPNPSKESKDGTTPGSASPATDSFQGVTVESLSNFAVAQGIKIKGKENAAELVAILSEYEWDITKLNEVDADMLMAIGLSVTGVEAEPAVVEDARLKDALIAFCTAQDIPVEADDDIEMLKERMNGFEYPENTITEEEKALLTEIGQEANIVKSAPVAPPPKKAEPPKKAAPSKSAAPVQAPARKAPPKKK